MDYKVYDPRAVVANDALRTYSLLTRKMAEEKTTLLQLQR